MTTATISDNAEAQLAALRDDVGRIRLMLDDAITQSITVSEDATGHYVETMEDESDYRFADRVILHEIEAVLDRWQPREGGDG